MPRSSCPAPALLGVALATLATAGEEVPVDPYPAPAHVIHDSTASGALVAAGTDYKVHADDRGFTFVPALGGDAPRNFPLRFTVESIETDGVVRAVERDAVVSREADSIRIERASIEARYELFPDFVEQTFLVHQPGTGEVRVSLRVESELQLREHPSGLSFEGPFGGVTYGAATAFTPDGRSCAVQTMPTARGLDLVVPASFAATCEGPLLIDPVIRRDTVATPGSSWTEVVSDVGADEDVGYLVAIERAFSATDHDIFLYSVPTAITSAVGTYRGAIDTSTEDWRQPSVAGRNTGNEFLVVARAGTTPSTRITGRVVDADGWTIGSAFDLSASSRANAPDVGSDRAGSFFSRPSWFVVWEEEPTLGNRNIRGRQVREGAALGSVTTFAGSFVDEFAPKLGETAGSSTAAADVRYTLAYRRDAATGFHLIVRQFDRSGTTVEGPTTIATPLLLADHDVSGPSDLVASNGHRAYIVVLEDRALFGSARSLSALVCGGAQLLATTSITDMADESGVQRQENPAIACTGDQWIIVYEETMANSNQSDVRMCSGDLAGDQFGLGERRGPVSDLPASEEHPAIASLWEGGLNTGNQQRAFATCTLDEGAGETRGAHMGAFGFHVCGVQYCGANENSTSRTAWIGAYGTQDPTTSKRIGCFTLPPNAPTYVLVSREPGFVPGVGGSSGNLCLGGNGFGRFSNAVGPASAFGAYYLQFSPTMMPQANGSVAALSGETWYFQGWFRDFQQGSITSNLTNAVAVTFD